MKHVSGNDGLKRGQIRTQPIFNFCRQNGFDITDIDNDRENEININMKSIFSKAVSSFIPSWQRVCRRNTCFTKSLTIQALNRCSGEK